MKHYRWQFWTSVVILIGAIVYLKHLSHGEALPLRKNLAELPLELDEWKGREEGLDPKVLGVLGVEDSILRIYHNGKGCSLSLYVGYYESQRQGDIIHSPKHCYPGSGWYPVQNQVEEITLASGDRIKVNRYLIQKGLDSQLVLYWYQERGRIITNEYLAKLYLIFDAITRNRTDGSLVRVSAPVINSVDETLNYQVQFIKLLFPFLSEFLPD